MRALFATITNFLLLLFFTHKITRLVRIMNLYILFKFLTRTETFITNTETSKKYYMTKNKALLQLWDNIT